VVLPTKTKRLLMPVDFRSKMHHMERLDHVRYA
jgi:hypothetical protein